MRKRYIQDPVTLKLIPAEEYDRPEVNAPMVIGDITPYKSMATGEMIMGRRQHREHLREHRLIEIGNEKPVAPKRSASDLKQNIVDAVRRYS